MPTGILALKKIVGFNKTVVGSLGNSAKDFADALTHFLP
jgi:hypothetical protein